MSRTFNRRQGLIAGCVVAGVHLLFLLYLHFAYHSVYEGQCQLITKILITTSQWTTQTDTVSQLLINYQSIVPQNGIHAIPVKVQTFTLFLHYLTTEHGSFLLNATQTSVEFQVRCVYIFCVKLTSRIS